MVIQHNLQAMNSNRMLKISSRNLSATTEKLSSGYRINRAADDAAGLSISEKMRKQIRGLTQASTNAEDGISSVQTAEGALQEVTDMLQRMNELCVQAANGTNSRTDRQYIQDELDQLISEIERVSETTKFNETYLLKGDSLNGTQKVYSAFYLDDDPNVTFNDGSKQLYNADGQAVNEMRLDEYFDERGNYLGGLFSSTQASAGSEIVSSVTIAAGMKGNYSYIGFYVCKNVKEINKNLEMDVQAGADSDRTNKVKIDIASLSSVGLRVHKLGSQYTGIVDDDGMLATDAIRIIAKAIQKISTERSALGAVQNRLEHTIKNLDNVVENTTSSESQIRDTDMAKEMVTYSNLNILTQAGQSMLAQSNQAKQGLLSILG